VLVNMTSVLYELLLFSELGYREFRDKEAVVSESDLCVV
jgi:hypothetical protein